MSSDDNLASWISGQCFWVSSVPASRYTQNGYLGQDFFFNPISIWYLEHGTWEWQITIMLISTNRYLHTDADKKPNLCQMIAVGFSDCISANVFCPLLPHGQLQLKPIHVRSVSTTTQTTKRKQITSSAKILVPHLQIMHLDADMFIELSRGLNCCCYREPSPDVTSWIYPTTHWLDF